MPKIEFDDVAKMFFSHMRSNLKI